MSSQATRRDEILPSHYLFTSKGVICFTDGIDAQAIALDHSLLGSLYGQQLAMHDQKFNFGKAVIPDSDGLRALQVEKDHLVAKVFEGEKIDSIFSFPEKDFSPSNYNLRMMSNRGDGILLTRAFGHRRFSGPPEIMFDRPIKIFWFRENCIQTIRASLVLATQNSQKETRRAPRPKKLSDMRHPDIELESGKYFFSSPEDSLVSGCGFSDTLLFISTYFNYYRINHPFDPDRDEMEYARSDLISSLHLRTKQLRKLFALKIHFQHCPVLLCDYRHGILLLIVPAGPSMDVFAEVGDQKAFQFIFITIKNRKIIFTLKSSFKFPLALIPELSVIEFCDKRFMVISFVDRNLIAIDMLGKRLMLVRKDPNQSVSVIRIDKRYPMAYRVKKGDSGFVLFNEILVILKRGAMGTDGPYLYSQRDYSEAPSDEEVFGPGRERGHLVHLSDVGQDSGRLVLRDYLRGKVLAKITPSSE